MEGVDQNNSIKTVNKIAQNRFVCVSTFNRMSENPKPLFPTVKVRSGGLLYIYRSIKQYCKENHQYITKAAYVVLGIQMNGRKDILGVWIGENESAKFWLYYTASLASPRCSVGKFS